MDRILFRNRAEAGRLLAGRLSARGYLQPVVLAVSPGGAVVGAEVAAALGAPLHLLDAPSAGCSCGCPRTFVRGCTVLVVDEAIDAGTPWWALLDELRRLEPRRIVVAAPVVARGALPELAARCDAVVGLLQPARVRSADSFYQEFPFVSDAEAHALLGRARSSSA